MRERLFLFLLILGFGILVTRLFVLQIVQGSYWREIAEGNRIRTKKIPALRGVIYDRDNKILVRNTPEGREYVYGPVLSHVSGYIGEVSKEELEGGDAARNAFLASSVRDSVNNSSHTIMGPMLNIAKNGYFASSYQPGDLVGKMGIERQYDLVLRGQDGGIIEEFNAQGEKVRELGKKEPIPGENLTLTLDLPLQKKISEVMGDKKGAVVALEPSSGEVLALVSVPSFEANVFTVKCQMSNVKCQKDLEKILNDKDQPLFNRAINGLYPPGSTFKIVTALAGLQEEKITSKTKVEDNGQITVGKWTFANWYFAQYGKTEGMVDIVKAIKRSNDIFFYKVGEWLGIENLSAWARRFGFGQLTNIDLPGEEEGLVPDKEWKKEAKGEDWYLGDDYITAIGQGDLLTTPLQVNLMTAVVANGGKWCQPYLIQNSKFKIQNDNEKLKINNCRELGIKEENLKLVKEGMREACGQGGTGWPFFKFKIKNLKLKIDEKNFFSPEASDSADAVYVPVACKTGTAESPRKEDKPHAWFTVFAPLREPEIVLTVLVESGGEGSSVAGPIAKEILKWWFERQVKS